VLIHDDLLATGGTAYALADLVGRLGGDVAACAFLVELTSFGGRKKLEPYAVHSLITFD
jgi:adenine phosphoribosyltransferase